MGISAGILPGVTWDALQAFAVLDEIERLLDELQDAARGSDSGLVTTKLQTLVLAANLLREYLAEAEMVS